MGKIEVMLNVYFRSNTRIINMKNFVAFIGRESAS